MTSEKISLAIERPRACNTTTSSSRGTRLGFLDMLIDVIPQLGVKGRRLSPGFTLSISIKLCGCLALPPTRRHRVQVSKGDRSKQIFRWNEVSDAHGCLARNGVETHAGKVQNGCRWQLFRVLRGSLSRLPSECRQSQMDKIHIRSCCV